MTKGEIGRLRLWINEWRLAGADLRLTDSFCVETSLTMPLFPQSSVVLLVPVGRKCFLNPYIFGPGGRYAVSLDEAMEQIDGFVREKLDA